MFFKKTGLCFFLLMIGFSSPVLGNLRDSECTQDIEQYGPQLFKDTLTTRQSKQFFWCLRGYIEAAYKILIPEPGRDHYTKQEFVDILIHFKFSPESSRSMMTKFFAFKKLFIGGKENQISPQELGWIYNLMDEYERVISFLQGDFPLLVRIFSGKERREMPEEEFKGLLKRLSSSLSLLGKTFEKEGFFYSLRDLDKAFVYLQQAGLLTVQNRVKARHFSVFLHEWANGIFGSSATIRGDRWKSFVEALSSLLSQVLYYSLYVEGRDLSEPRIFARLLKSVQFFLSSLEYVRTHPSGRKGFPLHRLDRMFQTVSGMWEDQKAFQSLPIHSLLRSLSRENEMPWILLTRALTCFSLPPRTANCPVHWGDASTPQVVSYHFPDGKFHFYEDRQEWHPTTARSFEIHPDQISYLKRWISYWSYNVLSFGDGSLPSYQGQRAALSAWMNGFFGQDSLGRIVFEKYNTSSFQRELSRSFMGYDVFIKLVFSSYPSQRHTPSAVNFRNSAFQLSPELWNQAVREFSPAFMLLNGNGFKPGLEDRFLFLREYADYFLNTSNQNGSLDYGEMMDLALHLSSAAASSRQAYQRMETVCGPDLETSCISEHLFSEEDILSHVPYFQNYHINSPEQFVKMTERLLPERITGFEDFMVFFLFVQMIETNFYFLDENSSIYLEIEEIFPLIRALAPKVQDAVPFIYNERQALAFLIYSAARQTVPFLRSSAEAPFQSLEFVNWTLHPEKWRGLELSRTHIFSWAVNFYLLYFQGN